jgi:GST-like protein
MIKVYTHGGPNPRKITILLEELGWPYEWELVDMYVGQHRSPEFLAVNPNGRLPALLDTEGPDGPLVLWESGAILQYLAEKAGQLLPRAGVQRYTVLKWLHFQVTHAPYLGNAHLYRVMYRDAHPFDIKRFTIESSRIYRVLEGQLALVPFVAGTEYSIADIAWYPWIEYHAWQGQDLANYPHIARWFDAMAQRPAVRKGRAIPWPYGEFGPSEAGRKAQALVERRLKDPAFALSATEADAALANLGI